MNIQNWLKQKLDTFELRVRGERSAKRRGHNDIYFCAGFAEGYKAAQRDARTAAKHVTSWAVSEGVKPAPATGRVVNDGRYFS